MTPDQQIDHSDLPDVPEASGGGVAPRPSTTSPRR